MRWIVAIALTLSFSVPARGQTLDRGLEFFDSGDFEDAALALYDVVWSSPDANARNEAVVYLGLTLQRMGLWGPASYYFAEILKQGPTNRRYLNAVEQLLEVQDKYRDHVLVAASIDQFFDGAAFANLPNGNRIDQINYLMGEFNLRRGKVRNSGRFLEFVRPESPYYAQARYLLGISALRQNEPKVATEHFQSVVGAIPEDSGDRDQSRLRQLAQLALARAAYGVGDFEGSVAAFRAVPRYSEFWFQALYEQAWAHYQLGRYGEALGSLESTLSPYFAKRHVPEAYVIQATTYFSYCQWDRVRRSVERYKSIYEPMKQELEAYLAGQQNPRATQILEDLFKGGAGKYPEEIAREVRRVGWFKDLYYSLRHLEWQQEQIESLGAWRGSRMVRDLKLMIDDRLADTRDFAARWVLQRLRYHAGSLKNFQAQIDILDFELVDAERQWLEQGREILKGRRARLPRPEIPNDQWQHWGITGEHWRDELGYYQHTMQSECN
ncbi:MAG: tetratricopeptide repeat protein [Myxococcota bacterium]